MKRKKEIEQKERLKCVCVCGGGEEEEQKEKKTMEMSWQGRPDMKTTTRNVCFAQEHRTHAHTPPCVGALTTTLAERSCLSHILHNSSFSLFSVFPYASRPFSHSLPPSYPHRSCCCIVYFFTSLLGVGDDSLSAVTSPLGWSPSCNGTAIFCLLLPPCYLLSFSVSFFACPRRFGAVFLLPSSFSSFLHQLLLDSPSTAPLLPPPKPSPVLQHS